MRKRMNIYITTGKSNLKYAYVAIKSLFINNQGSEIYLYVVSEDLSAEDMRYELELADQYGHHIFILRFNEETASKYIRVEIDDHWPIGTMSSYWLFHELLPDDVDRIMVIESDTVVIGDLSELYQTDFEDSYVICPGPNHKPQNHREFMKELQGSTITFVLSMYDVKHIREDFSLEDILKADEIIKQVNGKSQMEYAFGILFKHSVKYFPEKESCIDENERYIQELGYDYLVECEKTAKIIHFSSYSDYSKPWNPVFLVPGYRIWWKYAENSPYYKQYFENQWQIYSKTREGEKKVVRDTSKKNILLCIIFIMLVSLVCCFAIQGRLLAGIGMVSCVFGISVILTLGIRELLLCIQRFSNNKRKNQYINLKGRLHK